MDLCSSKFTGPSRVLQSWFFLGLRLILTCVDESFSFSHKRSETAMAGCYRRQTEH